MLNLVTSMSETINSLCIQQLWILGCGVNKMFWIFWVFLSMLKTKLFEYIDLRLPWLFGGLYAKSWRHCRLWEEIQPSKFGTTKHWCHSQMLPFLPSTVPPSTNTNPPGPREQYTKNVWRMIKFMIKLIYKSLQSLSRFLTMRCLW